MTAAARPAPAPAWPARAARPRAARRRRPPPALPARPQPSRTGAGTLAARTVHQGAPLRGALRWGPASHEQRCEERRGRRARLRRCVCSAATGRPWPRRTWATCGAQAGAGRQAARSARLRSCSGGASRGNSAIASCACGVGFELRRSGHAYFSAHARGRPRRTRAALPGRHSVLQASSADQDSQRSVLEQRAPAGGPAMRRRPGGRACACAAASRPSVNARGGGGGGVSSGSSTAAPAGPRCGAAGASAGAAGGARPAAAAGAPSSAGAAPRLLMSPSGAPARAPAGDATSAPAPEPWLALGLGACAAAAPGACASAGSGQLVRDARTALSALLWWRSAAPPVGRLASAAAPAPAVSRGAGADAHSECAGEGTCGAPAALVSGTCWAPTPGSSSSAAGDPGARAAAAAALAAERGSAAAALAPVIECSWPLGAPRSCERSPPPVVPCGRPSTAASCAPAPPALDAGSVAATGAAALKQCATAAAVAGAGANAAAGAAAGAAAWPPDMLRSPLCAALGAAGMQACAGRSGIRWHIRAAGLRGSARTAADPDGV